MDWRALASDVDGLVESFAAMGSMELSAMKAAWRSRGFSFIYGARPSLVEPWEFMRALYSCALDHLRPEAPILSRLGGFYVLYILYETQTFSPTIRIYLSLDDLRALLSFFRELKKIGFLVPLKIAKKLMDQQAFFFGCVSATPKSIEEAKKRRFQQIDMRLKKMYTRLFDDAPLDEHVLGDLAKGLEIDKSVDIAFREYNNLKKRIFERLNSGDNQTNIMEEINKASQDRDQFLRGFLGQNRQEKEQDTRTSEAESFIDEWPEEMSADFDELLLRTLEEDNDES